LSSQLPHQASNLHLRTSGFSNDPNRASEDRGNPKSLLSSLQTQNHATTCRKGCRQPIQILIGSKRAKDWIKDPKAN